MNQVKKFNSIITLIEKCYTMKLLAATIILYNIYN